MKPTGLRTYRVSSLHYAKNTGRTLTAEDIAIMDRSEPLARAWLDARGVRLSRRKRGFAPWDIPGALRATPSDLRQWRSGLGIDLQCDHEEQFVSPDGTPAIIVGHNYPPLYEDELRERAARYGLRVTINAQASWYFPDHTMLVEFSAP